MFINLIVCYLVSFIVILPCNPIGVNLNIFRIILFVTLCIPFQDSFAQEVNWLTWEEAVALNENEPRKILVEVYIKKCSWCKKMDKTTFKDSAVVAYINEHFYPVMFDAQMKEDIIYDDESYEFRKTNKGGYHEFAVQLLQGRLSFPTTVFLDEKSNIIQPIRGYQSPATFTQIVHYFNEDHYKRTPWRRYSQFFNTQKVDQNLIHIGGNN